MEDGALGGDASQPEQGADAASAELPDTEHRPSACPLTAVHTFAAQDVSPSIATDGRYLYYLTLAALQRIPLGNTSPELVASAAKSFVLIGSTVYYTTESDEIREISESGVERTLTTASEVGPLIAGGDRLFYCIGGENGPLFEVPIVTGEPALIATSGDRVGCVRVTDDALYWIERPETHLEMTRIVRADRDGRNAVVVTTLDMGPWSLSADEHTLVMTSRDAILLHALERDVSQTIEAETAQHVALFGEDLYFDHIIACGDTTPGIGNGSPLCRGNIERRSLTGELLGSLELEGQIEAVTADDACVYWVEASSPCNLACPLSLRGAPISALAPVAVAACSGKPPVPRCDPATCDSCFEIIPGYEVCAAGGRATGSATTCDDAPDGSPIAHACCNDAECPEDRVCTLGTSDAQTNFPPNVCTLRDECETRSDCGEHEICVPHFPYVSTAHCEPADCVLSSECEPGYVCAPALREEHAGNHLEGFDTTRCVPDPVTCTSL